MFFYLLENPGLEVKKIGITADIESVNKRYGSKWQILAFFYVPDSFVIKRAEQVSLQAIRMAQDRRSYLSEIDNTSGHTETFSSILATNKVFRLMKRSLKQSLRMYGSKSRIVTYKLYNKNYGKLRSLRQV
jgi:hypothetical protein